MKRIISLLALTLTLFVSTSSAKGLVAYQGEIDFGYALGVGKESSGRASLHTIQGISIGKYLSTGFGTGFDYHHNFDDSSEMVVPMYLNIKGYLPTGKSICPYLSCDVGASIGVTDTLDNDCGLYIAPAVGFVWKILKVQVGYNLQNLNNIDLGKLSMNSVQLKVGFVF